MHRSVCLLLFLSLVVAAQEPSKPQFTARELFYSAASEPAPPAKDTPKATAPAPAPHKAATPKKPPVQTAAADPGRPPASQSTQPVSLPGGGTVIKASLSTAPAPATGTPLGLRYTILKKAGDDMVETPPDTVFHAGDRIQFSVQTNGPGYLYIISRGSSGTWKPMFPSPDVADGNNHVDGWNAQVLPPGSRMVFDEQTGTERIFIVFSRTPEEGLENMIYSLEGRKAKPAADHPAPRAQPKQMVSVAMASIDDGTVGHLRDTYTRDLVIEKVDEKTPGDKSSGSKMENAVYVVNPSGSSDSRVVADLSLVHQ
jgi:hypothetical protein